MFLLRNGQYEDAVKALQFYRNSSRMSEQKLLFYRDELDRLISTREDKNSDVRITWKDFRKFVY